MQFNVVIQLYHNTHDEIISGFKISISKGIKCNIIDKLSLDDNVRYGLVHKFLCPWFTAVYKYNEYAAVKNLTLPNKIITHIDVEIIDVISIISLNRLIDGGAAILIIANISHHNDIVGVINKIPFDKINLRV